MIDAGATWRWKKGTEEASSPDSTSWRGIPFNDASWDQGVAPFFYGEGLTGTELTDMRGNYTSVYFRRTFAVEDPNAFSALRIRLLSDDGCAVWINGHPVVRFNVPEGEIPHTGTALGSFNEPIPEETYSVENFREVLVAGENVVAVQGLNVSLSNSSDFVFWLALEADIDEAAPVLASTTPALGSRVRSLSQWTVLFDEPVTGVDAADLRINGVAATNITAFGADQYVFEFAPQPAGSVKIEWSPTAGIRDLSPRGNLFVGVGGTILVDPNLPAPGVTISEFLADNDRTLNDEDGDASDWIEIENSSEQVENLAGWFLTDDPARPQKWRFPPVSITPRGYVVVFASGKNRTNTTGRLHTNFRLERSNGYLALVRPSGEIASTFAGYPAQGEDVSYGTLPTDPLKSGFFPTPTPGARNGEGGPGFAPEVRFSRIGGTFLDTLTVMLTTANPAATVRYTTDGTIPNEGSTVYTSPLALTGSTRLRARAYLAGLLPGPLCAEYYVQLNPSVAGVTSSLPLVVIQSYGLGAVPANGEYAAALSIYEPRGGSSALTNAPDLRTRVRLNRRGSSTLGQAKANYSVEFRDEREADRDLSPLGMPDDSDWILYAPNNFEPVLFHNPFIFGLSREIGQYAPRTRLVEIYVNTGAGAVTTTHYAGIYVLMEKIKRGADRVDIDNLEPEHTREPEVTGGYMLKVDRLDPGDGGLYAAGQGMGWVDPKEEEVNVPQREPQRAYIQNYLESFGQALYANNWRDPVLGWRRYVDEPSWVDHHLLNVMAFNVDALRLSAYFYKPRGGRLEFGPIWDFDRALASTDGRDSNPRVWRSQVSDRGTDFFNYTWWGRLFEDPDFWQRWVDRYQELRRGAFHTNSLNALVDAYGNYLRAAQPREVARWPGFTSPRISYQNELDLLKTWLTRRIHFMDTNFLSAPVLNPVPGQVAAGTRIAMSGPAGATLYYTTDGSDPRAAGGAVSAGARVYSGPVAIEGTAVLRVRARNPNHSNLTGPDNPPISTPWSGLVEARYTLDAGPVSGSVRFSEVHYHPAGPTAEELAAQPALTADDFEFVELWNSTDVPVDLYPLRFVRGLDFSFRTSSVPVLQAKARLLVVRNRPAFLLRYGAALGSVIAGEYQGGLNDGEEAIRLETDSGSLIAEARVRDGWHPAADGLGFSLVPNDESAEFGALLSRRDWRPSAQRGGSPGQPDGRPALVPGVLIHEALTHTDPPVVDGVELYNPTDNVADIGGWWLTDDRSVPAKYTFPAGTQIPPHGFLWVDEGAFNTPPTASTSFRLDSTGDAIWLFATQGGALHGYSHGFDFGAAPNGLSFGRVRGCDGEDHFLLQAQATPGRPNPGPRTSPVRITEIHFHPPDISLGLDAMDDPRLEFVEIANLGQTAAHLFDEANPTNTWRLKDSVDFRFPQGITLAAGEVVLVVNFDPLTNPQALARFKSAYGVVSEARVFGPYGGSLPNGEGRIELAAPDVPQGPDDPNPGSVPYVIVDRFAYTDSWSTVSAADGTGKSLRRLAIEGLGDQEAAWQADRPSPWIFSISLVDADGDQIPDSWERSHCLNPNDSTDAGLDSDVDGVSNRAEFLARTDPQDAMDVLRWQDAVIEAGKPRLWFVAKAGVRYSVESAETLESPQWKLVTSLPAGPETRVAEVADPSGSGGGRFYRLSVVTAP
ncbi:MAG: lamin tail domain-containing protein [Verrucomicrobiales bacterium]|nr:lamin tail domain-containing protein [Verrucomicrobiales bacterium]